MFNLLKGSQFESLTFKRRSRSYDTTSPNTPLNGFFGLQDIEKKWLIYLKQFSTGPPMRHTHTHTRDRAARRTHTHTHTRTHTLPPRTHTLRAHARAHARTHTRTHTHTHTHTHRHTHTHTLTTAIGEKAMRCISPKNGYNTEQISRVNVQKCLIS